MRVVRSPVRGEVVVCSVAPLVVLLACCAATSGGTAGAGDGGAPSSAPAPDPGSLPPPLEPTEPPGAKDPEPEPAGPAAPGPATPPEEPSTPPPEPADPPAAPDPGSPPDDAGAAPPAPAPAAPPGDPTSGGRPGSACRCDADCAGDASHPALCVQGICMTRASATCSAAGSSVECPTGSRCWGYRGWSVSVCWPDCASFACAGVCDGDGSCAPSSTAACDPACGTICGSGACSADNPSGSCSGTDERCLDGGCHVACSATRPDGYCAPGTECRDGACQAPAGSACPTWVCSGTGCTDLVAMPGSRDPASAAARADGYYVATEPRYAYLRRDLSMLVRYAACEVARRFPGTAPIGLSDLSQSDGRTPGTDVGSPRHPTTTHTGNDMDLAYYQTDGANEPQIICGDGSDRNGNGTAGRYNDGYFCTTEANIVDWPREAYWFAMLATSPLVRVFGIDQTLPDDFRAELDALLADGAITREQHDRALVLGYGASGGWQFHHHHSHMSFSLPR